MLRGELGVSMDKRLSQISLFNIDGESEATSESGTQKDDDRESSPPTGRNQRESISNRRASLDEAKEQALYRADPVARFANLRGNPSLLPRGARKEFVNLEEHGKTTKTKRRNILDDEW